MEATKEPYRIWFRGKPLQAIPQYVDRRFPDAIAAEEWAIGELHKRNNGAEPTKRFTRISIHEFVGTTVKDTAIREVMFGAG